VVVRAGAGLVPASPSGPAQSVGDAVQGLAGQHVKAFDLGNGERDQAGVSWWLLVSSGRYRRGRAGCAQVGGGDRADRQGGHDQGQVPDDRGVQADLGVVVAELVLPEFVIFFDRPSAAADPGQDRQASLTH